MTARSAVEERFAPRVRAWMRVRGLDIRSLSTSSGIPYRTLQNYLAGTRSMPASALHAICRALDISADLILFGGPKIDQDALITAVASYERMRTDTFDKLSNMTLAYILISMYAEHLHRVLFHDELRKGGEVRDELGLWDWQQPSPFGSKP